jgi:hypothetical protein
MLTALTVRRVAGLALPLAIGGSVLAVRAASASPAAPSAVADACTTTTGATTTLGSTTTAASTTTTAATTTTSGLPISLPITLPGNTTTTAATTTTAGTTTTAATTTTSGLPISLPITLPGGGSTTTSATTTTECATTTTVQEVRITSIASNHIAGGAVTVAGTATPKTLVLLSGRDRKTGTHALGSADSSSSGAWSIRLAHGVLYNTVVQASVGAKKSNTASITVHQVLSITSKKFVSRGRAGLKYKLTGSSTSHIAGEAITVTAKGKVVGRGKMRSNGTFTVPFIVKNKSQKLVLHGTGKNGSGVEYTLDGKRAFHV